MIYFILLKKLQLQTMLTTITNYADDNIPYTRDKFSDVVTSRLENDWNHLEQWFKANYLKSNEDKCQLLLNINSIESFVKVGNKSIYNSPTAKRFGITFDSA